MISSIRLFDALTWDRSDKLGDAILIKSELEFQLLARLTVLERLLTLPQELQPTHQSLGEDEIGTAIGDVNRLFQYSESNQGGFYLKNSNVLYDIRNSRNETLICNGYFDKTPPSLVKCFLIHMAAVIPIFGFACAPEEKEAKNRVTNKQGLNTIESWVGRDTRRYIPGLYWLTLLSAALVEKHGVSLSVIERVALEHIELGGDQHLFRFYEKPEDWRSAAAVAELCSSLPGVFDVEKIRPQLEAAENFLDLNALIRNWK
jgi:hypothetical protein